MTKKELKEHFAALELSAIGYKKGFYSLYDKDSKGGRMKYRYIGECEHKNNTAIFQGKKYKDCAELKAACIEWADSLPY